MDDSGRKGLAIRVSNLTKVGNTWLSVACISEHAYFHVLACLVFIVPVIDAMLSSLGPQQSSLQKLGDESNPTPAPGKKAISDRAGSDLDQA